MFKKFIHNKWYWIALGALLLMSIFPLVYISIYSRPCVDDFAYSYELYHYVQGGNWNIFGLIGKAFEVDLHFYQTWQGLYSSAFLLALQPGIFGEGVYFVGSWLLMALEFVCLVYFIKTVFKVTRTQTHACFLSIFIFVFFMQHLPSMNQGLYWYNGAWNYIPFLFSFACEYGVVHKVPSY